MSEAAAQMHTVNQMETPKSAQGVFELPCGYIDPDTQELITEVQVREITGYEEDMLASKQLSSVAKISALLCGCVVRLGAEDNKNKLARMLRTLPQGDRVFLVFMIRRVTLGDEFPVTEVCPNRRCEEETTFMIDIGADLDVKQMPNPMKRVYDCTLPSGIKARFRVSTGADEEAMAKFSKRKAQPDAVSLAILLRLELLDEEKPDLKMVKSLGMRDRQFLRDQFEYVEGGVDTTLEFECPACGREWSKDNLDLSTTGFFSLGGQRKR
jgi:hypothetical protein